MATTESDLLERIINVYGEEKKYLPFDQIVKERLAELNHLQSLHFNQYKMSSVQGAIAKKILQKVTRPFLAKQTAFNAAVYDVLMQTTDMIARLEREVKTMTATIGDTEEQKLKNSGLWFNEPIKVSYRENGEAYWDKTTERIVEKAFVLQSLARLYPTSDIAVLDIGAAESLLAYELASLGYSVTATDIRPIPLTHPNLKFVKADICKPMFEPDSFDCVTALSMLEHIGLGWYGDNTGGGLDGVAVQQMYQVIKPGGSLILTVPYGKRAVTPVHRIYDKEALQELVGPFTVVESQYGVRRDDRTMVVVSDEIEAAVQEHDPEYYLPGAVAMLICQKRS